MKARADAMPWRLVIAGCVGMFAATATGSTRAPFLTDMAADMAVSVPAISNLFGVTATAWGISSYFVGSVSDRLGRRNFLIGSPACLSVAMYAASHAQNYWTLVLFVVLTAMCCGAFSATVMAEVSLRTNSSHQGRALGYVMSGQSLTLLFGIPVSAWLGGMIGWRGVHVALALLALVAVATMIAGLRFSSSTLKSATVNQAPEQTLKDAMTGPVVRLFLALIAERICFGLAAFYYATYLRTVYSLPISAVALPLAIFAIGNIVGTVLGGQFADRYPYHRISFAVALVCAGIVAQPWFLWQPGVAITMVLGALFAFFNALARPPLLAALAEVPPEVRGLVMGLNSSVASIGWLTAALAGGWLFSVVGFKGFAPTMAVMCLFAAAVVVRDSRLRTH